LSYIPSWVIDKSGHFSNNVESLTAGIVPLSTGSDNAFGAFIISVVVHCR
jgi:hypothetical protein